MLTTQFDKNSYGAAAYMPPQCRLLSTDSEDIVCSSDKASAGSWDENQFYIWED